MTDITAEGASTDSKTFSQSEVEKMIKERTDRERENSRLKHEENERLKKELSDLSSKMQKGIATTDEMTQLQTATKAAEQGQQQGYSQEDVQRLVEGAMQQKDLESKLMTAKEKDPEFKKLVEENAKTNAVSMDHVLGTAYLPNAVAVVKHLMKDKKSLDLYNAAIANVGVDRGVSAMMVLNNLSDKLQGSAEKPMESQYKPAEHLSDASDEDQNFDESSYIGSKY